MSRALSLIGSVLDVVLPVSDTVLERQQQQHPAYAPTSASGASTVYGQPPQPVDQPPPAYTTGPPHQTYAEGVCLCSHVDVDMVG